MSDLKFPEGWLSLGAVSSLLKRRRDVLKKLVDQGYFDSAIEGARNKIYRFNLNRMTEEELARIESTRTRKWQERSSRKGAHLIKDWIVENRMAKAADIAGAKAQRKEQFLRDLAEEHEREAGVAGETVDAVLIPPRRKVAKKDGEAEVVQGLVQLPARSTNMTDLNRRASTNKKVLSARFLDDVYSDWETHGLAVLKIVRRDRPQDYLKVVASLLPRDIQVAPAPLTEMSDEEIVNILANIKSVSAVGSTGEATGRVDVKDAPQRNLNILPE